MNKSALLASTAVALVMCAASATAQMQQKSEERQSSPGQSRETNEGSSAQRSQDAEQGKSGSTRDQRAQEKPAPDGKGTARSEPSEKKGKGGTAQKEPDAKETNRKGTAEQATEPKGKQGTAEKKANESKDKQGTAERPNEPKEKSTKGAGQQTDRSKEKAAGAEQKGGSRVQLSEQQRTNLHQKFSSERNLNRVTNVNFSINVGTRIPRSVRLVVLPVAFVEIVPQYRSYRYFAYNDEICIVDPATYEIVEVIRVKGSTVAGGGDGRLMLTEQERQIVLREIDSRSDSTLGLGALSEGADVPREARLREFPLSVMDQVPKLQGHRFFTAEGRVAISDRSGSKIDLVIEDRR